MKEINVAFNKGLDELAQSLRAFPESLPISPESREFGVNQEMYSKKEEETFQEVKQENEREI